MASESTSGISERARLFEPFISLSLRKPPPVYFPGDELDCEFQIDAVGEGEVQAVEVSVLWYTEGKGDQDLGVHYFKRRQPADAEDGNLRSLFRFQTTIPNSPLSYEGHILKIRWCVRVRAFLRKGKEVFFEQPFQVGDVPPPALPEAPAAEENELELDDATHPAAE